MALEIERETTEYVYIGMTGTVPAVSAETAFLAAAVRPTTEWDASIIVNNSGHALWADAVAALGPGHDYFVARLVGSFGGTGEVLAAGSYQPWVRLTDTIERPVRRAPVTITVL